MKFAFNIDSKLWKFFDFAGDLVILNLLFLLTSLPVVTIGASVTAMDAVLFRKKEKRLDDVRRDYFKAFRANFKDSTIIWCIFLAFLLPCALNFYVAGNLELENKNLLFMGLGAILAIMLMTALYSFAMLARFQNNWQTTIAKAFLIGVMSLPYTVVIFLVLAAALLASIQTYLSILVACAVWLIAGFSLAGFLCCEMFYRAFRRFTRKEDLPKDTLDEEMYARRESCRQEQAAAKSQRRRERQRLCR